MSLAKLFAQSYTACRKQITKILIADVMEIGDFAVEHSDDSCAVHKKVEDVVSKRLKDDYGLGLCQELDRMQEETWVDPETGSVVMKIQTPFSSRRVHSLLYTTRR